MHAPRAVAIAAFSTALLVASAASPVSAIAKPKKAPFNPGSATAVSQALQIAPQTGGLSATVAVGTSIADYRGTLAQASSQALSLGVIGTTLTTQCDASPPTLTPDQLPQPLIAESDTGKPHAVVNTVGTANSGVLAVGGQEIVTTTKQPTSSAKFNGNKFVVPAVMTLSGLNASSYASLDHGNTRIATATSSVGSIKLLGGVVTLGGMKWVGSRKSGASNHLKAHFTMDSASIAGQKLPVASTKSLTSTIAQINSALKPTGLFVSLPKRKYSHGILTLSPLIVGISQSAIGNNTINPILTALSPITNQITDALIGANCKAGSVLSVIDLAMSAVDGTGALTVQLGGVSAANETKSYGNAFGNPKPPKLGGDPHHNTGHHQTTTTTHPGTGTPTGNTGPNTDPSQGSTSPSRSGGGQQFSGTTTSSSSCATTSPAGRPSCSGGAGVLVGVGALGLLILFAATDFFVLRRRRVAISPPGVVPGGGTT